LSDSCALVSVTEEVVYPVQIIGDSVNLQLNHQFIVADMNCGKSTTIDQVGWRYAQFASVRTVPIVTQLSVCLSVCQPDCLSCHTRQC